jgi:small subunit ribosomal protein S4
MSRITCKKCRRLGESLCGREKCAYKKRPYAPGKLDSDRKHRSGSSEFGEQLRAKQKMRITYGLMEKQFASYVTTAMSSHGKGNEVTPELSLYRTLESRLDNVVFRMGLASSRALARQLVSHGHILVNGKRLTIASHKVKVGDVIAIREGSKSIKLFTGINEKLEGLTSPVWMTVDPKKAEAKIAGVPREVETIFDYQKVLEFYSR